MATPLAEPADVEAIWRTLETTETTQVNQLIVIASQKLRSLVPGLDTRLGLSVTAPTNPLALDPVVVANVVATVVKRVMVNPDGLASTTQTFGPISEQRTFVGRNNTEGDAPAGEIVFTADDLGNLAPVGVARKSRMRSTQLGISESMMPPYGYRTGYPGLYPNGWAGDRL